MVVLNTPTLLRERDRRTGSSVSQLNIWTLHLLTNGTTISRFCEQLHSFQLIGFYYYILAVLLVFIYSGECVLVVILYVCLNHTHLTTLILMFI